MTTYTALSEPTTLAVRPGRYVYLPNPLNQADALKITLDWAPWLDTFSETISSVAWAADGGVTVSGTSNTTTTASATLTAGTIEDTVTVECAVTTSGSQIRSVGIRVEVVNLR